MVITERSASPARKSSRGFRRAGWRPWYGLAALLLASVSAAQAGVSVQFLDRGDGLPSDQVHDLVQGPEGFLWFAGPAGLIRYDGSRVTVFRTDDGLATHGLRALAVDQLGRLWVGTDLGVDLLGSDGGFTSLVAEDGTSPGFVEDFAPAPDGAMWIASRRGLFRESGEGILVPAADDRLRETLVTAVEVLPDGTVWAAVASLGLLRRSLEGRWETPVAALPVEIGSIRTLTASGDSLFVGGLRGLVEIVAGDGRLRRLVDPSVREPVTAVLPDGDELWLGVGGQLRLYHRGREGWVPAEVALDALQINELLLDDQGNVWIASESSGVGKISALRRAIHRADTPCETQVYAVRLTPGGDLLVGGSNCSWRQELGGAGAVERFPGLDRVRVWDLLEDRGGTLWAATEQGLWSRRPGGRLEPARLGSPPLETPARALLVRDGALWVGTVTGLVVIENGRATEKLTAAGKPLGYVYTLEEDPGGGVWIGTIGSGLWRDRGGRLGQVTAEQLTTNGNVYSVATDEGRAVVIQDNRIVLLEAGDARTVAPATDDAVAGWSTLFGARGALWVGGASGLARYDLEAGRAQLRLTSSMGLPGDEFTTSRSLLEGPGGRLYCGLEEGLAVVDPGALADFSDPPRIRPVDVSWTNARLEGGEGRTVVEHGRWSLEVATAIPWYLDERSLLSRHRLRGFDAKWSSPGPGRSQPIHYTALPAGSYVLEGQAFSPLVGWGPVIELLSFEVLPPWWRRTWALLLYTLVVLSLVLVVSRWRTRLLRARSRELETQVSERTAELSMAVRQLEQLALFDELTNLPNQRSFWDAARRREARVRRHGTSFSLVVLDLDYFKKINDQWGHRVGDMALCHASLMLEQVVRDEDLLARYGGEEFVVLLSEGSLDNAMRAAERMRAHLQTHPYHIEEDIWIQITASFGVSVWQGESDTIDDLFRRADAALYAAKVKRNAVVVWSPEMESESEQVG